MFTVIVRKKPHTSLDAHETCYWDRGSHSPTKAGRFYQRDIDFSVLIILTNLWKLLRQPEGPFYTTINIWQLICLPSLHLLSLYLRRGFRRTPANHTMRLTWTFKSLRQVKYSCDTSSFTLSRGLVLPFWSLVLISSAVTSAVYVWTLRLTCVFSWSHTTSKLCRWLAGCSQRITAPYFIRSSSFNPYFYLLSLSTYIIPWLASKVKGLLIFLSVIGKGIEPYPTNGYHLSILSYLLVI